MLPTDAAEAVLEHLAERVADLVVQRLESSRPPPDVPPANQPTNLTYRQAAQWLGVTVDSLRRAVGRRELDVVRLGHRAVLIPRTALVTWLADRTIPAENDRIPLRSRRYRR